MNGEQTKNTHLDNNSKAIIWYLILTYIFNCLLGTAVNFSNSEFLYDYQGYIYMYGPGIAALIAHRINRDHFPRLGLNICPVKYLVIGAVIPICYMILSYSIYWIISSRTSPFEFYAAKISLGSLIIGIVFAFGEELWWRGFLTPPMTEKFGYIKASLLVGVIWGLWHNPVSSVKLYGLAGTFFFLINTLSLSFIMGYLRLCSKSVWPAVLVHAFHNEAIYLFYKLAFGTLEGYPAQEPLNLIASIQAVTAVVFIFLNRKKLKQCLQQLSLKM